MDREEILRRFEARLDAALGTEDAPRGIPEELLAGGETGAEDAPVDSTVDRYRMWAAITAVTQEVKLQGRTFKELSKQLSETLGRDNEARSRKEVLDGLLELRERLLRGVEAAGARDKVQPVFWDRLFRRRWEQIRHALEVVDAMAQGYALSLKSLDDLLARFEVRPIECKGEAFDPRLMSAVDVEETLDAAEGTVVAVYRTGYELNGAVYRTAQVRVARRPRRVATDE